MRRKFLFMAGTALVCLSMSAIAVIRCQEWKEMKSYRKMAENSRQEGSLLPEAGRRENPKPGTQPAPAYNWNETGTDRGNIAGWLYLPGSLIDFPVAMAADNDFYLTHNLDGKESSLGCLFMDKDTKKEDFNRVIYGHNMGTDSSAMFSTLLRFEKKEYFLEHRAFYFAENGDKAKAYEVMAVMEYDIKDMGSWDFRKRNFHTENSFRTWMEELRRRALYFQAPEKEMERMLVLSTCDRRKYGTDGRFLIFLAS